MLNQESKWQARLEANRCARDGGGVPTQAADIPWPMEAIQDNIIHEIQRDGNATRVGFFLGCLRQLFMIRYRR